jgi:glycerol-3-phosphate dehydrogenase (NAD(P)+)
VIKTVAIIGATTWGTTLGIILARCGIPVTILTRTPGEAYDLNSHREHRRFLPSVTFPQSLVASSNAAEAVGEAQLAIVAVPSDRLRQNIQQIKDSLIPGTVVLNVAKGLEMPEGKRMSQIMEEELPPALHSGICVLSGPNLAKEIARGKPASTVIAGRNSEKLADVQDILMSPSFRVYTSRDVVGVELGGALKNIIALGAGFADGLEIGDNIKAAFITRGLAEITRLGVAAGAQPMTFAGLAGLGDIVATCASRLSRNRHVGEQLARGQSWPEIRASMDNVAEGVITTGAALKLAQELDVEMPIARVTQRVLFEGLPANMAIAELMGRPPRPEWESLEGV